MTKAQRNLAEKHGTPPVFATAVYAAVPDFISMDEAAAAVVKYGKEWTEAGEDATQRALER